MANFTTKFYSPSYTSGYTSSVVRGNENTNSMVNNPRGVFQVSITTGDVNLQMRVDDAAPWFTVKTYSTSTVEEIVIAPQMRVVATANAEAWVSETH